MPISLFNENWTPHEHIELSEAIGGRQYKILNEKPLSIAYITCA